MVWHDPGMRCTCLGYWIKISKKQRGGEMAIQMDLPILHYYATEPWLVISSMFGAWYVVLAKTVVPDQNNHDSVRLTPLPKPSKISSYSLSVRGPCSYTIASPVNDQMVSSWPFKEHESFPLQRRRWVFHVSCATSSSSRHSLILMCYNSLLRNTGTHRISLQMAIELKEADLFILSEKYPEIGLKSIWKQAILCVGVSL